MIKNQWYAVLSSHQLRKGRVLGARRFGEDLVFFRNAQGDAVCAGSLCPHRRASLAGGRIQGGHLKCPFHGIEFDASGRCIYIPSEGRASAGDYSRFRLKTYPVREIGGILFVWYGDGEPSGEPDCFDVMTDDSFTYDHVEDTWKVDYSRVIENQLDVSHLAFVHHNTIGRGGKTLCNGPKVLWLDDHTLRTSADNEKDLGQTPKTARDSRIKDTSLTFKFPNLWLNHVSDRIMILAYFVPVDDEHAIIALRFYNRITGIRALDKAVSWLGSRANVIVERQDKRVVETQRPVKTGVRIGENLVSADLPVIEYRTKRDALQRGASTGEDPVRTNSSGNGHTEAERIKERSRMIMKELVMDTKAMYKLSYGLFVCTAVRGDKKNGCIINTAVQVASEPNRISIAVNKANYTHDMVMETGECNISVISKEADFDLFKHFGFQSGRDVDKFADYPEDFYQTAENGIPFITRGTNAYFSLKVESSVDLGSHTLFICRPVFMTVLSDAPSCTYEYYQSDIKPKPQAVKQTSKGETVWRCVICGYEWVGEELPDDFICPVCKHPKADFEKIPG